MPNVQLQLDVTGKPVDVCGAAGKVTIVFRTGWVNVELKLDAESAAKLGDTIVREAKKA